MAPRQVSGLTLDPTGPRPILQDVVDVDHRGRVRLPTRITSSVSWLSTVHNPAQTLMVLDKPGRIALLAWEPSGPDVLARRSELVEDAESGDGSAIDDLLDLEGRYHRRVIPKDYRLSLGSEGLLHLGLGDLPEGAPSRAHIAGAFDRIFIMSTAYRAERIRAAAALFPDLP
jgi:hypothetical protein